MEWTLFYDYGCLRMTIDPLLQNYHALITGRPSPFA